MTASNNAEQASWYAAKCVFLHSDLLDDAGRPTYEERIVLFRATSFEHACSLAEEEARKYASECSECRYIDYVDIFRLFDANLDHGTEVWSLMRTSDLDPEQYLDRFYDSGTERAGRIQADNSAVDLDTAYCQMAEDEMHKTEALEWAEATIGDVRDEPR